MDHSRCEIGDQEARADIREDVTALAGLAGFEATHVVGRGDAPVGRTIEFDVVGVGHGHAREHACNEDLQGPAHGLVCSMQPPNERGCPG